MGAGNVSGHLCVHYATNRHLIFSQDAIPEKQKKAEDMSEKKKRRRSMTPEKLALIQEALDRGQSINSIANQEDISEFTIRYHKQNVIY